MWMHFRCELFKNVSSFYSCLPPQEHHISLSRNSLLPRSRTGRSFWPSQKGGSWSGPTRARGGWSAPLPRCPSGSSLPPCALCTSAGKAECRPPCPHTDLASLDIVLPHVSRSHCSTPSCRRRWCSALLAKSVPSRCWCESWSWWSRCNTSILPCHTSWILAVILSSPLASYPLGAVLLSPESFLSWLVASEPPLVLSPSNFSPQGSFAPRAYNVGVECLLHLAISCQTEEKG